MREIELAKLLGDDPTQNIVKFVGCVTTQSKRLPFYFGTSLLFSFLSFYID